MDATEFFGTGPQIHYANTRAELARACAETTLRSDLFRRKLMVNHFIVAGLTGLAAVWTMAEMYPPGIIVGAILLLIWTTAAAGLIALTRFWLRRAVTNTYRISANLGLFDGQIGEHKMILTEQGVLEHNDRGVVLVRWPYITGLESTARDIRLRAGPSQFFLVPKSAFADEEASQAFEAAARSKMQEAKAATTADP